MNITKGLSSFTGYFCFEFTNKGGKYSLNLLEKKHIKIRQAYESFFLFAIKWMVAEIYNFLSELIPRFFGGVSTEQRNTISHSLLQTQ